MLQIPPDALSADVLDALIEEFVTRHGTDLTDAATKARQVRAQLRTGEVVIVWDEKSESANIVSKDAKEEPPPPPPPSPPRGEQAEPVERRHRPPPVEVQEDGRRIVYD